MSGAELYPAEPTDPQEIFRFIGDTLSIEFNECSVAAAELNNQVEGMLTYRMRDVNRYINTSVRIRTKNLYSVGSGSDLSRSYIDVGEATIAEDGSEAGLKLAIMQRIDTQTTKRKVEESYAFLRSGDIKRRKVRKGVSMATRVDEPILGLYVADDSILPIATFAKREYGVCSYVQLGDEAINDNLYVVESDQHTSRHQIVESIRAMLVVKPDDKLRPEDVEALRIFALEQLQKHKAEVLQAKEHSLVRRIGKFIEERKGSGSIRGIVINENTDGVTSFTTEDIEIVSIMNEIQDASGRSIKIALGRSLTINKPSHYAIASSTLFLPLATFDAENTRIDFGIKDGDLNIDQRLELVGRMESSNTEVTLEGLLKAFDVTERLDRAIGPTTPVQERFKKKISQLVRSSDPHLATLSNIRIGNTMGDAMVRAEIIHSGTMVSLLIEAQPVALETDVWTKIKQIDFDVAAPVLSDEPGKDVFVRSEDGLQQLLELLSKLS